MGPEQVTTPAGSSKAYKLVRTERWVCQHRWERAGSKEFSMKNCSGLCELSSMCNKASWFGSGSRTMMVCLISAGRSEHR